MAHPSRRPVLGAAVVPALPIVRLAATVSRSPCGRRMRSASPNLDAASTHPVPGACGGGRGREGGGEPVVWRERRNRDWQLGRQADQEP